MSHAPTLPRSLRLRLPILLLGASTATLQTLAVREGMASSGGNEAVVGSLFGIWMLLTAAGSALGRSPLSRQGLVPAAFALHALSVPLTILAARAATGLLAAGVSPSLTLSTLAASVILAPSCVVSGWLYARLAAGLCPGTDGRSSGCEETGEGRASAGAYLLDTLGAGIAGIVLALWVLDHALPFQAAGLAAAASLAGTALLIGGRISRVAAVCAALAALALWLVPVDRWSYRWHAPGQRVVTAETSARGALLVVESMGQRQLLVEREAVLTVPDDLAAEWMTHVSLGLHPAPRRVLSVGVSPAGATGPMRAHGVESIDEVVGDPRLASLVSALDPGKSSAGARVLGDDERSWVRANGSSYDVVLVQSTPPSSISGARLFSLEFYRETRRRLAPAGIVVVRAESHASYAGPEQRRLHSGIASTLRAAFAHVLIVPGPTTLYAASDAPLPESAEVARVLATRASDRGVMLPGATRTSIADATGRQRMDDAARWASMSMPPSSDAQPIAYRLALEAALAQLGEGGAWTLRVLALLVAALAVVWFSPRSRPVAFAVATTGFAGLAVQLVLMLVYQTAAAALYRDVALVNAAFMAASCAGTWWAGRAAHPRRLLAIVDLAQAALAAGLAVGMTTLIASGPGAARAVVVLGSCAIGVASGAQIGLASHAPELQSGGTGGTVFAIDLIGAAFAALVTYAVAVPMLGLAGTALGIAAVKTVSTVALVTPPAPHAARRWALPGPAIALLVFVILGSLEDPGHALYAWTVSDAFSLTVVCLLVCTLAWAFESRRLHERMVALERRFAAWRRVIAMSPSRAIELLVLLPVGALPLARCYFKVPFVFCHTCPRPCAFGILRPYVVPAALVANLGDHRFCEKVCPFGQAQRACERSRERRLRTLGRLGHVLRLVVLIAVALLYPVVRSERRAGETAGFFGWFYLDGYGVSAVVLGVSGALLIASFFVHRPFCDGLCPIGGASDLLARIERRWWGRRAAEPEAR